MNIEDILKKFVCDGESERLMVLDITEIELDMMESDGISPDAFEISISEEEGNKIRTVDDLIDFLKENKK
ncbi:MAG: hypothetical protein DRH33_00845 [Candidatus Nealsonbacteria bacterium]|nr:MAG: hypothetical protein DRH33_00845 [Candidatus Nealsonbacteria bacterium]